MTSVFQSTPPVRGATRRGAGRVNFYLCFNPRPPCGERRSADCWFLLPASFQSTPPVRGATIENLALIFERAVSIHAPRAGSDHGACGPAAGRDGFNPRPPCGERRQSRQPRSAHRRFNPRPPCGERPPSSSSDSGR